MGGRSAGRTCQGEQANLTLSPNPIMKTYRYFENVQFSVDVIAKDEKEAKEIATEFIESVLSAADKVDTEPKVKRWDMNTTDFFIDPI
ncbi:hypothetical protein UFOVP543_48 [uncultured Caudovirales phage]|uniref:Uncharacterized protein n=1 Tax=uncultured Caudovirales phage TaxID=2100421 RepID=A0A6J5P0Q5_9CAUD|nr:hypothetical protein UFOVP543_48 [uncultured Caudovirales phage]CAB4163526.1 hypothetical protein UFOVP804_24 [uncultured Caudovirales phage]